MVVATLGALVWANVPWPHSYESFWTTGLSIRVGHFGISQDLRHWVNDGLMTFFFLVVGLEARRELQVGQLRERRTVVIPAIAALGGMAVPVAIYLAFNPDGPAAHSWGAAMSTDTALLLGVLSLVAPAGNRLRVRALTLALSDDLVALLVITVIYTRRLSAIPLATAIAMCAVLAALRRVPIAWRSRAVGFLGVGIWVALYEAGTDPVITGVAVGLVTSAHLPHRTALGRAVERVRHFREQPTPELARTVRRSVAAAISPNERLQHLFHRWTSFVIVPLFALANAGIHLNGHLLRQGIKSPITLGIVAAYALGKPLGITTSAALALRSGIARRALSTPAIAGTAIVAGVGFTSSLLIASVALHGQQLQQAKLGILATVVVASVGGLVAFRLIARLPPSVRARQLAGTTEDIVDLADDVDAERDHIRGAADAPVTLIEYGDYECLYCGQAEAVVRELLISFGEDLRYVWRHLPLTDVHPHAQIGAEASEAAAAQGAFWGMHELLLAHQDRLTLQDLVRYARQLGLDVDRFRDGLGRHAYSERVAEDVASADASGVVGTPSFFVNGKRLNGAYDLVTLSAAVRAARAQAAARSAYGRLRRQERAITSGRRPGPGPDAA